MKFKLEQIAIGITPHQRLAAVALLDALGISDWTHDTVAATGHVHGAPGGNRAELAFNYDALADAKELELLCYTDGPNWIQRHPLPEISHIGMHVTENELEEWRALLEGVHRLAIVQEVLTHTHTNPVIAGKRWYHYVIFGARHLIGVDIKFIVRRDEP